MVDRHATGLALAGVVLAAGGVWLRWRSPRRASDRGRLSPLSRWHYSSGSGLDRDQPLQAGMAEELPRGRRRASTRSPRPRRRRMLVRMDLAEIVDQRRSPSTTPPTACPARHRNRSTAPHPPRRKPRCARAELAARALLVSRTDMPTLRVLHQICTPLRKPRSDSERNPETVSVRSSTRRRTRNPVRRDVHSRRLPPPHHGRTGRQTRCGGTL